MFANLNREKKQISIKKHFPVIKNRRFSYINIKVKIGLQFAEKFSPVLRAQR